MNKHVHGQSITQQETLDWEGRLLADESLRIELPCTLAELNAAVEAAGADASTATITSCAHVAGRDVVTVRFQALRPARRLRAEFTASGTGDDCAACGADLAHHVDGLYCA